MKINEEVWNFYQKHLGYTDDEIKRFMENPRNIDVISKAPALMNKTIVVEIMDSHGCNSQHKAGDKFYFDGSGNLLTKLCPKRICFGALHSMSPLISMAHELFYAGIDPNDMRFKRVGCFDVGVQCGGWGRIVMELRVEDRKNPDK
ncbi:MAG: hypothetical protein A2Z08_02520 [Deltaproteobacteria bacterium RBG_16_54_11]|jgi:uncharacterized repeat protein (TIGR04076 family)|nr:MAG: hypothetical protein A2Z08_02520 [Deltaproteobacteria bacterium RBG_16_54_11]